MARFSVTGPLGPEAIDYGCVLAEGALEALHKLHTEALSASMPCTWSTGISSSRSRPIRGSARARSGSPRSSGRQRPERDRDPGAGNFHRRCLYCRGPWPTAAPSARMSATRDDGGSSRPSTENSGKIRPRGTTPACRRGRSVGRRVGARRHSVSRNPYLRIDKENEIVC
jgi:hypothetical protein